MNQGLADRHGLSIAVCLGEPGRMISPSKTGYRDAHPLHVAVFNANVCFAGGKVWWGDIDLTLDEASVMRLAAEAGQTVYVLYEFDGRFRFEDDPNFERAVYSVTPSGHSRYDHTHFERREDGGLYERPPTSQPRLRRPTRPHLWRFWRLELRRERWRDAVQRRSSLLLYVGARGGRSGPLLLLGIHRWTNVARGIWFEWTWCPSGRRRWAPSIGGRLKWHRGPVRPFIAARLVPGVCAEVRFGLIVGPADPIWG